LRTLVLQSTLTNRMLLVELLVAGRCSETSTAALRLLLFTGCRLREILNLRWEHVDLERGCLFLPESKIGRKTVILNAPALAVLNALVDSGTCIHCLPLSSGKSVKSLPSGVTTHTT
jgi:integrase